MIRKVGTKLGRRLRNQMNRRRLKNPQCTILSNNCNAGIIYHDLNLRMMSPTINLYILPQDFIRFVKNLEYYLEIDVVQDVEKSSQMEFPVGIIDDISIYFMHYHCFEEAKNKWNERKKRVNLHNYCVVMAERDGCTLQDLQSFDQLECTKVALTHKAYPQIKSSYYIKGYEDKNEVGILSDFIGNFGKRGLDQYDYVGLMNSSQNKESGNETM